MAQPNYRQLAVKFARRAGIDPNAFLRQINAESGFRPDVTSGAGAQGIAQIMPGTARAWGVNPNDPVAALRAAALHMAAYQKQTGSLKGALEMYNLGHTAPDSQLPAETRNYVAKIAGGSGSGGRSSGRGTPSVGGAVGGQPDLRKQIALSLLGFGNLAGSVGTDPLTLALEQAQKGSVGSVSPSPSPSGGAAASTGEYPLGKRGKIIGTPFAGTHAKAFNAQGGSDNWQSENAVDISVPVGTPVYAEESGTLGNTGSLGQGGRFAGLRTNLVGKSNSYYYAHLSKLAPGVHAGARVKKGQLLGYSGAANGVAHLHFAVQRGDPRNYVR